MLYGIISGNLKFKWDENECSGTTSCTYSTNDRQMATVLSASRPQTMQIPSMVASSSTAIGRLRFGESAFFSFEILV